MEQAKSADDKWREQCFQAQKDKNDKFKKNALEQAKDLEMRRNVGRLWYNLSFNWHHAVYS